MVAGLTAGCEPAPFPPPNRPVVGIRPRFQPPGSESPVTALARSLPLKAPDQVRTTTLPACTVAAFALLLLPLPAAAQELEPGAYWPLPAGLNIVSVVNTFNWGDLAFDPSAPIDGRARRSHRRSRSRARSAWQVDRPTPVSRGPSSADTLKAAIWASRPK